MAPYAPFIAFSENNLYPIDCLHSDPCEVLLRSLDADIENPRMDRLNKREFLKLT